MILISQASTLPEDIPARQYETIYILYSDKDVIPVGTAQSLMAQNSQVYFEQIPAKADDITLSLVIGRLVTEYPSAVILVSSEKIKKAVVSLGGHVEPPKKKETASKKKVETSGTKRISSGPPKKVAGSGTEEAGKEKEKTKRSTIAKQTKSAETGAAKPAAAVKIGSVTRTRKPRDPFDKILHECGIESGYWKGIRAAVDAADEELSYEMRLRFNIPDAATVADIYEKSIARFKELKAAVTK